jgi:hypothetical protein
MPFRPFRLRDGIDIDIDIHDLPDLARFWT